MFHDRRRSERQAISRHAKLTFAGSSIPRDCVVSDMSEGGVRLHVEGVEVPDQFALLVSDGAGRAQPRECHVVWRLGFELGAEFLNVPSSRPRQKMASTAAG